MSDAERLAIEAIRSDLVWAVVGASQDPERYGHEVVEALRAAGKKVLPVNPRCAEIDGSTCYPSLEALPEPPGVVLLALAPERAAAAIAAMPRLDALVWLPPGCWSEQALEACRAAGRRVLHNVCPVGLSKRVVAGLAAGGAARAERRALANEDGGRTWETWNDR